MGTTKDFHDYVMDNLRRAGDFSSRKMMGEYCVYYKDRLAGGIYDNCLLVKQTESSCRILRNGEKVYPYEGSKTLMLTVEDFENTRLMQKLFESMYPELPQKKK